MKIQLTRHAAWLLALMVALEVAVIFIGFSRSYFRAGLFLAPLPTAIVHIHGALMTLWFLLLFAQALLVATGYNKFHRKLGVIAFVVAVAVSIAQILVSCDMLARNVVVAGYDPRTFSSITLCAALEFAVLVGLAWRYRRNPEIHFRLILISSIGMTTAAFARWPLPFFWVDYYRAFFAAYLFFLLLIAYDLLTLRRIHRATLIAGIALISLDQLTRILGPSAVWHSFAGWIERLRL